MSSAGSLPAVSSAVRDFLARLARACPPDAASTPLPAESPATLRAVSPDDDLPARFARSAESAGCGVRRAGADDWPAAIAELLAAHSARRVLVEPQPGTALTAERAALLQTALRAAGVAVVTERDDETLFTVDAAVTGVQRAIAETGTLVCMSGAASARGASLIPPVHIALVSTDQLVADLFDLFEWLAERGALPANVNLITGPSKTADIEGVLVTGVHGPGAVHIVLV